MFPRTTSELDWYWQPGECLSFHVPDSPLASSTPQPHHSPPLQSPVLVDILQNLQSSMETQFQNLSSRLGGLGK